MSAKKNTEKGRVTDDADIKQELLDSESSDVSTDTMDKSVTKIGEEKCQKLEVSAAPENILFNAVEDNNPLMINSVIKQEPTSSADLELIKSQVHLWRVVLQRLPNYTHTDVKQEPMDVDQTDPDDVTTQSISEGSAQHEMEEIKYVNAVEDNNPLMINSVIKQEPTSSADLELIKSQAQLWRVVQQRLPTYTHTDVKQEPMDVEQTDPDDVTTQSIPEGSAQHEMEEIKYINTQDYLDIGETVICEQDRAISEQDRARPGTSSKDNQSGTEGRKNNLNEKPYICEFCDRRFTFFSHLKRHLRTHTGEKPYKCKVCDYRCSDGSNLKKHVRTHTGEKPYKCKACYYRCTQGSSLIIHMRTHSGEKPYKCEACDYRCSQGCTLNKHMRKHTGEKPYKCEACEYRCNKGIDLQRHVRTHTFMRKHTGEKPYKCEACEYRCNKGIDLQRHVRTHTGEKPYKCESCYYRCSERKSLKIHMRTHT